MSRDPEPRRETVTAETLLAEFDGSVCPACHHRAHDPGGCSECPRCELHTDEAAAFVLRYEPDLLSALPVGDDTPSLDAPVPVERLAHALSTWHTISEGERHFEDWAVQLIRAYLDPRARNEYARQDARLTPQIEWTPAEPPVADPHESNHHGWGGPCHGCAPCPYHGVDCSAALRAPALVASSPEPLREALLNDIRDRDAQTEPTPDRALPLGQRGSKYDHARRATSTYHLDSPDIAMGDRHVLIEEVRTLRRSALKAETPEPPALDAAWKAAEDALPEGWWVVAFEHDPESPNYRAVEQSGTPHVFGPWSGTPASALLALLREAARLTSDTQPPAEPGEAR